MANWAFGTVLTWNGTAIAKLKNMTGPSPSASKVDMTTHDSPGGIKEFVAGLIDSGELSLDGLFEPGDAGQVAINADFYSRTSRAFVLTLPAAMGANISGTGIIIKPLEVGAPIDGAVPFKATIAITGAITVNVTASNNFSALAGIEENTGAALDLVPNFAAGTYAYNVLVNTASTWVKFTATFAAGICSVLVGGVVVATMLTTVQSGAIAIGAADSLTQITITVKETNKVAKTYVINVARP